jgi:hypothetical protein
MVQQIIEHLTRVLNETGYFQKIYPLSVLVKNGNYTKPVHYVGGGALEDIIYFSNNEGLGYFRKVGDVSIDPATVIKTKSCSENINQYSYTLKFIACVPKVKAVCDDAYADDMIAQGLISSLGNITGLSAEIGAKSSSVSVTSFNTVGSEILKEEFGGQTIEFPFQYSLISLTISAVIIANSDCFKVSCYNYS